MNYIIDTSDSEVFKGTDNKSVKGYRVKYKNDYYKDSFDAGGFVEAKRNLSQEGNCRILDQAACIEDANVSQNACIRGRSIIKGRSRISGNATIGNYNSTEYDEYFDSAFILGDSLIRGGVHVNNAIIDNSIISGDHSYVGTHFYPDAEEGSPVGVIDCELSGNIKFRSVHLIKNITSNKNLIFDAGAYVLDDDEYFFIEFPNYAVCVYRERSQGIVTVKHSMSSSFTLKEFCESSRFRSGVDDLTVSIIMRELKKTVLRKWSRIVNGIHYKFKILKNGDCYGLYNENTISADEAIIITVGNEVRQPLSVDLFKIKTGVALTGIPSKVIDQAIAILFDESRYDVQVR